jgi:two-component system sensor histidine kinase VicK
MTIERWTSTQLATTTKAVAHNLSMRRLTRPHPPAWAVITIRDDGIGIAREDHARIFERFYQVAASLTRKHGGTGLGLALVIDLVRLHDGIVWVESKPDHGSAFFVALPAAHAEG